MFANQPVSSNNINQFQTSICKIKIPNNLEVIEAVSENVSYPRTSGRLIVTDGRNLAFLPTNEEHNFADFSTRQLRNSDPEDSKIIRRLFEKALEISIGTTTEKRKMQGIFLLDEPVPLYRCEKAHLSFVIVLLVAAPLTAYAHENHSHQKCTTLYSLTFPPQKKTCVMLSHPSGQTLTKENKANIEFNKGVEAGGFGITRNIRGILIFTLSAMTRWSI